MPFIKANKKIETSKEEMTRKEVKGVVLRDESDGGVVARRPNRPKSQPCLIPSASAYHF